MIGLTLQDFTSPEGLTKFLEITGPHARFFVKDGRLEQMKNIVSNALQHYPALKNTRVIFVPTTRNALYNYDKKIIILGLVEPSALAHEIEHANSIKQEGLYRKVLSLAKGVTHVNRLASIPAILALNTFVEDKDKRTDILNTLSAVSVAAAAPVILEEAQASIRAARKNPDVSTAKTLGPAFLSHLGASLWPTIAYQIGRR